MLDPLFYSSSLLSFPCLSLNSGHYRRYCQELMFYGTLWMCQESLRYIDIYMHSAEF